MNEREQIMDELKHLLRYYCQAAHEFFDEATHELESRAQTICSCIEKNQNSLDEYRKMIEFLVTTQSALRKRVEDMGFLTDRMNQLLKAS